MKKLSNSRRAFIKNSALVAAGIGITGKLVGNTSWNPNPVFSLAPSLGGAFEQAPLGYGFGDLEPHIDAMTMEIHYSKHHAGYVKKLNAALENAPEWQGKKLEDILMGLSTLPDNIQTAVRNNGGGHFNHAFFWQIMSPNAAKTQPSDDLRNAMIAKWNDAETFKAEFSKAASSVFGSGWAWVIKDREGNLDITSTPNQDNPLMDVVSKRGLPIIGIDVWEHAYYLKNQNRRGDYINSFLEVVNWEFASMMFSM